MKKLFEKYGIHIIVEVFIIVVGVLIALQVNNWNEIRKEKKQLKGILKKVIDDWESDTMIINQVIEHYEPFVEGYDVVMKKEVTEEYLDTCLVCRGLITSYFPYKAESSGLELLKKHVNSGSLKIQNDTTINNIIHGQSIAIETLNQMAERIKNDVDENLTMLSRKTWFADLFIQGTKTPEFRVYYKSVEFRNQTIQHRIFVEYNLLFFLKQHREGLRKTLPELKEKYNEF